MGIDAEMFVKVRGQHLTEDDLKALRAKVGDAFGTERFFITCESNYVRHSLQEVQEIHQDSADENEAIIRPLPGEQFIQVSLYTRYYGPGYERGDFGFIYLLYKWLELNIPEGEVWYGGDSSGVLFRSLTADGCAEKLLQHYLKVGHQPYRCYFQESLGTEDTWAKPPKCIHPLCGDNMSRSGFGPAYALFTCVSCGRSYYTKDSGVTWLSAQYRDGLTERTDKIYDAQEGVWKVWKDPKAETCKS